MEKEIIKLVTLKIPENKFDFYMELFKELGIEVENDDFVIPEEHKKMVLNRIKYTREEELSNWSDLKNEFDGIRSL